MRLNMWSDEERWLMPRRFGFGYTINLKYVAKRLGWVKSPPKVVPTAAVIEPEDRPDNGRETPEERLRRQIDASKYEEHE
jgi:hypothetical protein